MLHHAASLPEGVGDKEIRSLFLQAPSTNIAFLADWASNHPLVINKRRKDLSTMAISRLSTTLACAVQNPYITGTAECGRDLLEELMGALDRVASEESKVDKVYPMRHDLWFCLKKGEMCMDLRDFFAWWPTLVIDRGESP